jgi:hypothetical protein
MAGQKSRPGYSDPEQRREMHRLELGEAISTGDQERVDEMVGVMKARGDRDISWEMRQSERAYSRFMDDEAKRDDFKPVTLEEMVAQQKLEDTQQGLEDELTPDEEWLIAQAEASQQEYAQQQGAHQPDYGGMKAEQALSIDDRATEPDREAQFYEDLYPEQDHEHEH